MNEQEHKAFMAGRAPWVKSAKANHALAERVPPHGQGACALDRAADACVQIAEQQSKPWPESRHESAVLCSTTLPEREYQEKAQLCRQVAMQCADAVRKVGREMIHDKTDEYDARDKPEQPQGKSMQQPSPYEYIPTVATNTTAPTQPQGDVIERMAIAAFTRFHEVRACLTKGGYAPWPGVAEAVRNDWRDSAEAAAKVLLDEALGPVTDEETNQFASVIAIPKDKRKPLMAALDWMFAARRARLLPESKRTAEERVKVERMGASEHVFVMLDGDVKCQFDGDAEAEQDAEIYRLGLIAQLKAGQQ